MANQTDTYSNLLTRIQALAGVDNFSTTELTQVNSFINRRSYQAYRASDLWARDLVVGQVRPGPLNIIPWEYDETASILGISTATRSGDTITVTTTGDIGTKFVSGQYVTIAGVSGSVDPTGSYQVTVSDDAVFSYDVTGDNTGTETYTVSSGTASPDAISDVDSFIRIFSKFPGDVNSAREFDFFTQSDGAHVIGNSGDLSGFYVTYKKQWGGPYDATNVPNIPLEQFNFIAHAAYADFLRLDKQISAAQAEEAIAEQYLAIELQKPQNRTNSLQISRISTHVSRQSR